MPTDLTLKRRLLDNVLDISLDEYVTDRRKIGTSWTVLADDLSARAGVAVSREALRRWYGSTEDAAA